MDNIKSKAITYPTLESRPPFYFLLILTRGDDKSVEMRRIKALELLQLSNKFTTESWRHGPEFDFMMILAEQLISLAAEQRHDYRRELADFKIYFNEQGVMRRVELTCDIVALEDGLTKVEAVAEYMADLNPGVVSIEPLAGCDLASLEETPDRPGHVFAELSIPTLAKGDRYSYTYRIVVKSEQQSRPIFYHEVAVPTDALSFLLWFKESSRPTSGRSGESRRCSYPVANVVTCRGAMTASTVTGSREQG